MPRPVISYDDITLPYDAPARPNPPKKRKRNNHKKSAPPAPVHHWDDPTTQDEADEEEESRELTHDEIWDDSALIDAWNAAMEEYEAYHGSDKDAWKKQPPVHKSPLWYNVPPPQEKKKKNSTKSNSKSNSTLAVPLDDQVDSQPIDFDTFVPTHDPSLSVPAVEEEEETQETYTMPLSQDEAFERAVQASYWSGYWTAVYHYQRQNQTRTDSSGQIEIDQDMDGSSDGEEEFISTQR